MTAAVTRKILSVVQSEYPGWENFDHPAFVNDEISYKRQAAQKALNLLAKDELATLLSSGHHDEILRRLERVGTSTNLLYRSTPQTGDLSILYDERLDRQRFAEHVIELLYGSGESADRLDRYAQYVREAGLPNKWTFPTYLLFLCHPGTELFVKPRATQRFLSLVEAPFELGDVGSETYKRIQALAHDVQEAFADFGASDMIDVQSLIWVCRTARMHKPTSSAQAAAALAPPFSDIFRDAEQANWAFDFLAMVARRLGIRDPQDARFAFTVPGNYAGTLLRLSFGKWLVLDFHGGHETVHLPLFAGVGDALGLKRWAEPFIDDEGSPEVVIFDLTMDQVRQVDSNLLEALNDALDYIVSKFSHWKRCPYRGFHRAEIAEAAFDMEMREEVLTEGLAPHGALEGGASQSPFTKRTFDLLSGLHQNQTKAFYDAHKSDFKTYVEQPFKALMRNVAARLPTSMRAYLETERGVFSKILKNDYGQGGAWPFYWGAFYPKGSRRIKDVQLFAGLRRTDLEYGFYIGEHAEDLHQRFTQAAAVHLPALEALLESRLGDADLHLGPRRKDEEGEPQVPSLPWRAWLQSGDGEVRASVRLGNEEVLELSEDELAILIVGVFERLYPLILLAGDEPLQRILAFAKGEVETPQPPSYSLADCAADTGYAEDELVRWLRALERKGQAILYGPPGTGKTYLAEHLARHLVSGGDGFAETVQFHPAYSYEDFIQGLRPRGRPEGGLDYAVVPGRFLEFCRKAEGREGLCVLIIDEINRANLSQVFGELMYLLEYRDKRIPLAGGEALQIPQNVRIIGTMNTADRSIALVDHALRRRFAFIALRPRYDILAAYHAARNQSYSVKKLAEVLKQLNAEIADAHYEVGVSFFMVEELGEHLEDIWRLEIEPYLEEYFFDQPGRVEAFCWDRVRGMLTLAPTTP